jgi:hypothetical protein
MGLILCFRSIPLPSGSDTAPYGPGTPQMETYKQISPLYPVRNTATKLCRASPGRPPADSDEQRLDVHNGVLLSALWDVAFDQCLVSFADDGTPRASPKVSEAARTALRFDAVPPLRGLQDAQRANLSLHRTRHGF